jgi:hypothetical protein
VLRLTADGARVRTQLLRKMSGRTLPLSRLPADQQRALIAILEELVEK